MVVQNINTQFLIAQCIGFLALGFTVAMFQVNKRRKILSIQICSAILYAIHFVLLAAPTGALMNLLGGFRSFVFLSTAKKSRNPKILLSLLLLFGFASLATWQGMISLLPLAGMSAGTLALWQSRPSRIRLFFVTASLPWFAYNFIVGSYPGMMVESFALTSNLIGMYRFDIPKRWWRKFKPA